jgi:natural product biosynthesis luciferase-like monooxygenase protein/amino acid adenylation domain-containing protein/FkbM family methyltransferase
MDALSDRLARLSPEQLAALMQRVRGQDAAARPAGIPPRAGTGPAPLSFAQQRLWFVQQLDPANVAYNMVAAVRVEGALDRGALARALDAVVERHDALRTVVTLRDGEPVQQVVPGMRVELETEELPETDPAAWDAEAERRARAEAERPFDLAAGPLMRALLLRLAPERHVLVLTLHHVISDGWSRGVIVREISVAYTAFAAGQAPVLPPLPVQYADYAEWQRERMRGEALAEQLAYWTEKLAGAPPALVLPTDHPRPAVQSFAGRTHRFRVSRETADALRALAREEDATLFMVLLAAFKALLARYTGQADLVVGTPAANRGRTELEGLVGFFANTLALRTDLAGDPTFREALRRVRDTALGAYAHEEMPFERLVEALHPERSLARNLVFQVMFLLDEAPLRPFHLPGVELAPLEVDPGTSMFDLTLGLESADDGLAGRLEYATALFDADTAARMAEHLGVLLDAAAAAPDTPLSALPLMAEAERAAIGQWNATDRAWPAGPRVHDLFAAQAERTPDAPALVHRGETLSYAELDARANRLAHHLRRLGAGVETRVGVCLDRTPDLIVSLLAVLKAGGAYVPLDPAYPRERLGWMMEDADVRLVLTTAELAARLPDTAEPIPVDILRDALDAESADAPESGAGAENLSHVIFTSGSTGRPKGVMIRHASVVTLLQWMRETMADEERESVLASTAVSFDVSVAEIFGTLCWGGKLVLVDNALELPAVADQQIRYASMVPTAAAELLRAGAIPPSVRTFNLAGEALPNDLAQALYALGTVRTVRNVYGPTEDTTYSTCSLVQRGADRVLIGRPLANTRTYVLDERLQPAPVGVPGELYLAGDGVARGYAAQPALTAERFLPDPFGPVGARMYRVMDRARWTAGGELEYLGRTDFQVKVRGFRIEPGEVETALRSHPSIRHAVAVVREDAPGDRRLVAYLVAGEGAEVPSPAELRAHLKARLPEYMVPSAFVALEELPLTSSGKVDRRALPAPEGSAGAGAPYVAPRTEDEERLARLFAEALGTERVGIHDDFFAVGGHSLLAMRVVTRLREALGVELPVRALFESPTVAELAPRVAALRHAAPDGGAPLRPVARTGALPLSFAQQRLWFIQQLDPASTAYNMVGLTRLEGELDVGALRSALDALVERHEVLRTVFSLVDGNPVQRVLPAAPVALETDDLGEVDPSAWDAETERRARAEQARPFDLAAGPLLRVRLLRLAPDRHVLLLVMHHVISDGWSRGVMVREISALYTAFATGEPPALPPLAVQYADYAVWQRERMQGAVLEDQLAWWTRRLEGAPPALALPTDHPRPAMLSFAGRTHRFRLPDEGADALRALAREEGATTYMVLLAAFNTLLARYTGQDDLVVGTPVANRGRGETEALVGFFVNTLALRTDLSGDPSFRQVLARVRETALGAYAHDELPFERLVEELHPDRGLSRTPVFQALFVLDESPLRPFRLPGLVLVPVEVEPGTSMFDLTLGVERGENGMEARLEYATDLFDAATIERMAEHFGALLRAVAAAPDAPVSSLTLAADAERALVAGWNATDAGYPAGLRVHDLFAAQAARTPDAPALVFQGEALAYAALDARANRLANHLRRLGAGVETRVGVCLERTPELIVSLLAVLKSGGAYVPLDPALPRERLGYMVQDGGVRFVLTTTALADRLPAGAESVRIDAIRDALDAESAEAPETDVHPENLSHVIFTSGSTGRPKGVMISHASTVALLHWMRETVADEERESVLASTPVSFDVSVAEIFGALCWGGKLVLVENALELPSVADQGIRYVSTVPGAAAELLRAGAIPASVRTMNLAGEALPSDLAQGLYALGTVEAVRNLYGPTEDTSYSTYSLVPRGADRVLIGRPLANSRAYVLDAGLRPAPLGVPGELYLAGAGLARGYALRPGLTAERFLPDPFGPAGSRMYRTLDRVRWTADGELEYFGRTDFQVKVRGFRIELGEIETALRAHPAIHDAVVVVREDVPGDRRLAAYVATGEGGEAPPAAELRAWLRERLPEYMLPSAVVALDALPQTPSGKTDRRALPAPDASGGDAQAYVAPRTPAEEQLATVFAEVLGVERVGVHDDFFALGGHSLLAMRAATRVRGALGVELPVRALFEAPTVAALAPRVDALRQAGAAAGDAPILPVPRGEPLPLSFAQQRLWFIQQLDPANVAYNMAAATRLEGTLDADALRRALDTVVQRHEALRTVFAPGDGEPVQRVLAAMPVALETDDLGDVDPADADAEVERRAGLEQARPFDLAAGPLLRARLLRLTPERHVLLLVMHHVVGDGWSRGIIVREISALYTAYVTGREPALAPLPVQYPDYAVWQRARMQGERLEAQLGYWTDKLAGAPPTLELPADRPRPARLSFAGRTHRFPLPADAADALRALAREEGATLFMVLLAAFKTLLARYTGQGDLVVGTPVANRGRAETEGLVGFFANTLALRTELSDDPTFREALARVRETALGAYAHEELPFERLVDALGAERSLSRSPVFQVMFLLDESPLRAMRLPGLELAPVRADARTSLFDLTLGVENREDGLTARIEYATDLFDAATVERMVEHFRVLLAGIAAAPDARLSALPLLPAAERVRVVDGWNATAEVYPAELCLHDLFAASAARTPDAPAVSWTDGSLSYAALDARSNRLARHLRARGVGPDARVGICLERGPEMMVAVLGVLKAGGACVPVDPAYPAERIAWMLADSAAPVLVTQHSVAERLPATDAARVLVDDDAASIDRESAEPLAGGTHPDGLAYVIYTSGSTGRPKGVAMPHRPLVSLLAWQERAWKHPSAATTLQFTTLSFDVSFQEIFSCWVSGGRLVLVDEDERRDFAAVLDRLEAEGVERLFLPYVALQHLADLAEERGTAPRALREVQTAGEQLRVTPSIRRLFERTGAALSNQYGPSETHVATALVLDGAPDRWPLLPGIGAPVANARGYVLDAAGAPTPVGVPGELYLAGVCLARGYLARPALTAERFVPDPFVPGARAYRTGDRARWLADGTLEFLGRVDDQVKVRGFRVEPGEIEAALEAHDGVRGAAVVVREDAPGDRRLVGYVVPAGDSALTAAELREHLKARLPEYMVPSAFVVMDAFPLTPSGKVARRALPAPDGAAGTEAWEAPRTPAEEILAGIYAEVLRVERVGAHDDFFALGGHSLLATRVTVRVRQAFGVELPVRALFEAPTVAGLAPRIEALRGDEVPGDGTPLVPVDRGGPLPLSFAQRRMWWAYHLQGAPESYNLSFGLRLEGELDAEALRRALEGVVARHEALRTRFAEVDGEPMQFVEPAAPFELPVVDLSPVPPAGREARVAKHAEEDAARPFDLGEPPLVRATLLRLDAAEHVLLASIHHIAGDGWSMALFTDELRAHYDAARAGTAAALPPLAIQYGDYSVWQRARGDDAVIRRQLAYWKDALAGVPAATELPADRPRPPVQRFRGETLEIRLDAPLAERLRAVARAESATLYMVLLAGFGAWLRRYTGQDDLVVGSPVAGRDHPALEPLIGCFINVVPLRLRMDGAESFRQLLARVRGTALDAFQNAAVSFDQVVEEAGVAREASRNALVQVLFALQNTPPAAFSLPGLEARPLGAAARTSRYDLSVYAREEADGGLSALVEYDTDLYDRGTVERWMRHYTRLLESLSADPALPAGTAEMLDAEERARVLQAGNQTDAPLDPDDTLVARFAEQARRTPDAPALVAAGETLSYGELAARANRLAHRLRAAGIGPESRVGLLLDRSASMVAAMLGVLRAGGAYVPLDPAYPADRVRFVAQDAGLALVLADEEPARRFPDLGVPVLAPEAGADEGWSDAEPAWTVGGENPAYVIYTSGSTGRPKGVVVQHRNVAAFCAAMDAAVGAGPATTWLAVTSISFDISVLEILWTLSRGARVVLHGDRPRAAASSAPAADTTDFSLFFFSSSDSGRTENKYRLLMEGARYADRNGFHAVWTPERHFHDFGGLYPNPAVTGAAVAAVTERVKIRAGSVVLPLQDTLRVAEEWSVVDNLSGGRVEVSFASGWHANDFVLRPENFETRREVMFTGMDEVRALWRGEKVSRVNGKGATIEVGTLPRPLQPELPVWITAAGSPDTFRRAGAAGAHLLTHLLGQSVQDLEERIRVYRDARREAGMDPDAGRVALMLHTYVHEDADFVRETVRGPFREYLRTSFDLVLQLASGAGYDPKNLSPEDVESMLDFAFERYYGTSGLMGTPDQCVETVRRLRAIGVDEVACLADFGVDEDLVLQGLAPLAEVMRRTREAPVERFADGATVAERIRLNGVTHLQCTPSLAGVLAADPDARGALAGLECILVGGEALPAHLAQSLREAVPGRVLNMYGPTETTVWSSVHAVDGAAGPVPLGRPVANTRIYVVDGLMQPVPDGVAGELLIGGAGVVRGYLGRPALTAERFVPDPFGPNSSGSGAGGRLYRTGDLARRREDGALEFLGRMDQQVKVRGHRVEPGEVEAALAAHPAVRESVVVARDDGSGEHRLVAYVTPAVAAAAAHPVPPVRVQPLAAEERERILAGLPRYTLPDGAVVASQQDSTTRELYTEIFEDRVYLRHGLTLEDEARVVDVGSNIGMFTVFAHSAARGVRTWSFEPIPDTFARLRANAALAGGENARVFNTGVAHEDGTATFVHYPNSSGLSGRYADLERDRGITRSLIENWMSGADGAGGKGAATLTEEEVDAFLDERFQAVEFQCSLRTLSSVIREEGIDRIDLLKVDVEKSEYDVLLGIDEEHWPLIRQISMEVDTEELLEKVTALLDRHGFAHVTDRYVTIHEGAPEAGGEHVYMLYARRPEDGALAAAETTVQPPTGPELRRWLGDRLPDYMVPSLFVTLDALPLTPNGKVDRKALPEPAAAQAATPAVEYVAPTNDLEAVISAVWCEVLGVERVGIRDNFFELGGTSVRLASVHRLLGERLQRPVTVVDLFRHPTVMGLAEFLSREDDGGARAKGSAQDRGERQRQAAEARQQQRRGRPKR